MGDLEKTKANTDTFTVQLLRKQINILIAALYEVMADPMRGDEMPIIKKLKRATGEWK